MTKTEKVKSVVLKNHQITFLASILQKELLHGQQSRSRNRFFVIVNPILDEIEKERITTGKKYVELDEKGGFKTDEENNWIFNGDNKQKFFDEYTDYLNENRTMDVLPSNRETWIVIRKILEETKAQFDANE